MWSVVRIRSFQQRNVSESPRFQHVSQYWVFVFWVLGVSHRHPAVGLLNSGVTTKKRRVEMSLMLKRHVVGGDKLGDWD